MNEFCHGTGAHFGPAAFGAAAGAGGVEAFAGALDDQLALELVDPPRMWKTRRPVGVVVSMSCLRTTRPTPGGRPRTRRARTAVSARLGTRGSRPRLPRRVLTGSPADSSRSTSPARQGWQVKARGPGRAQGRGGYPHFHSPACPHSCRELSSVFTQMLHRFVHRLLSWQAERLQVSMRQRRKPVISRYALLPGGQEVTLTRIAS